MPIQFQNTSNQNSDEVKEIITAIPSWILRWGISLVFLILLTIVLISAFIRYPDIVKTQLKVNSLNSPKEAITHQSGKLIKILVENNQIVKSGAPLAFIESTGNHYDVLRLKKQLDLLSQAISNGNFSSIDKMIPRNIYLGELQTTYQSFYQEYTQFANTLNGGYFLTQKAYLERDLNEVAKLKQQILKQKQIQQKEFDNLSEEFESYKTLKSKNVISNSEFRQQENKYLSGKYPLERTATDLINNNSTYLSKQKELITLENTIKDQQSKFFQALNSMMSETDEWILNYIVSATITGKISYVGILQENQNVKAGQDLFVINPGNSNFFGEVRIPQYNMGKVSIGQRVLVKLHSYPFEEYGFVEGKISYLTDVALKDSVFFAKVDFQSTIPTNKENIIVLKPGMLADAEIITKDNSLLQRFFNGIAKIFRR